MYFYLAMIWKVFKNSSLTEHLDLIEELVFVFVFLNFLLHFPAGLLEAQRQDIAQSHKANLYCSLNLKVYFCLNINCKSFQYYLIVFLLVT